jgi:hypothetical protein
LLAIFKGYAGSIAHFSASLVGPALNLIHIPDGFGDSFRLIRKQEIYHRGYGIAPAHHADGA